MIYLGSINLLAYIYATVRGVLSTLRLAPPLKIRIRAKEIMDNMARMQEMQMKLDQQANKKMNGSI